MDDLPDVDLFQIFAAVFEKILNGEAEIGFEEVIQLGVVFVVEKECLEEEEDEEDGSRRSKDRPFRIAGLRIDA